MKKLRLSEFIRHLQALADQSAFDPEVVLDLPESEDYLPLELDAVYRRNERLIIAG